MHSSGMGYVCASVQYNMACGRVYATADDPPAAPRQSALSDTSWARWGFFSERRGHARSEIFALLGKSPFTEAHFREIFQNLAIAKQPPALAGARHVVGHPAGGGRGAPLTRRDWSTGHCSVQVACRLAHELARFFIRNGAAARPPRRATW